MCVSVSNRRLYAHEKQSSESQYWDRDTYIALELEQGRDKLEKSKFQVLLHIQCVQNAYLVSHINVRAKTKYYKNYFSCRCRVFFLSLNILFFFLSLFARPFFHRYRFVAMFAVLFAVVVVGIFIVSSLSVVVVQKLYWFPFSRSILFLSLFFVFRTSGARSQLYLVWFVLVLGNS